MKFAIKLAIALLTAILLFGAIGTYAVYTTSTKILEAEVADNLQDTALNTMETLDRFMYERTADIRIMASAPIMRSRNSTPEEITKRLIEYRNIYGSYISISFFDMNMVRIADTSGMDIGVQHPLPGYWEDVLAGKIIAGKIAESVTLKIPVIFFAAPVKDENEEPLGFIASMVALDKLYEILESPAIQQGEEVHIDLIDKNGLLIYSNENKQGILTDNYASLNIIKRSMAGEPYGHEIKVDPLTNEKEIYVFAHEQGYLGFKGNDYTLLLHIPTKTAFAPAASLRNQTIMITGAMALVAVLFAVILSRRITKSIRELHKAVQHFATGDLTYRAKIKTRDEIEQLGDAFNNMAAGLEKAAQEQKKYTGTLEKEVAKKTKDLSNKLYQLEIFTRVSTGREMKMTELKEKIKKLEEEKEMLMPKKKEESKQKQPQAAGNHNK